MVNTHATNAVAANAKGAIEVEAELSAPTAHLQLVHYHFAEPPNSALRVDGKFRVELCLSSRHRSARACFSDVWNSQRYERIGDLFVLPPGLDMRARSDEATSLRSFVCQLDAAQILRLVATHPELTDRLLLNSLDVQDARIRTLLVRLAEEVKQPGFASNLLIESMVSQLVVDLLRHGIALTKHETGGGLAPWQLRRIEERLQEVREAPTLSVLAELCRISIRQLTRGFRASRGCSIGAYVARHQMEHAKALLIREESVASIAYALGFASTSNFCAAFRRAMGVTPGRYRKIKSQRE